MFPAALAACRRGVSRRFSGKGQVTIPQAFRAAAGWLPPAAVEFVCENDQVVVRPARHDTRKKLEAAVGPAPAVPLIAPSTA